MPVRSVKLLSKGRRLVWCGLGLVVVLALAGLAALALPQQVLCVESGPMQGDVIVVVGGSGDRARRAAELFRAGAAPRILVSGEGDAESNRRLLIRNGVPAAAIAVEPNSRNTQENARFSAPLLRGARRVILVTTWYHSRRALQCFRHYVPGIQFYSRPSYYAYKRSDWTREGIRPLIRAEYLKLLGYWVRYGVWPVGT